MTNGKLHEMKQERDKQQATSNKQQATSNKKQETRNKSLTLSSLSSSRKNKKIRGPYGTDDRTNYILYVM
jgi:hypothetical protein